MANLLDDIRSDLMQEFHGTRNAENIKFPDADAAIAANMKLGQAARSRWHKIAKMFYLVFLVGAIAFFGALYKIADPSPALAGVYKWLQGSGGMMPAPGMMRGANGAFVCLVVPLFAAIAVFWWLDYMGDTPGE